MTLARSFFDGLSSLTALSMVQIIHTHAQKSGKSVLMTDYLMLAIKSERAKPVCVTPKIEMIFD